MAGLAAQCGHYIAKQCGLTAAETPVLLGDLGASSGVAWTLMHSDDTHASQLTTADLLKVAVHSFSGAEDMEKHTHIATLR